jgi:hypothetical protein
LRARRLWTSGGVAGDLAGGGQGKAGDRSSSDAPRIFLLQKNKKYEAFREIKGTNKKAWPL